jgi:tRNA1Val (adenine37-N6)-methyltransferase
LNGNLTVYQNRDGYRFSIDAAILAFHAAADKPAGRILDLGTGCAIIPMIIAHRQPAAQVIGVEIQPELAALARHNVEQNGLGERIAIIEGDFTKMGGDDIGLPVNMVTTNPPYYKRGTGRINPHDQKALARHEIMTSLDGLVKSVRRFLTTGGCGWIVYPVERLAELLTTMQAHHLEPKYIRLIHSQLASEAKRCLVKVVKAARAGLTAGPPLVIYNANGGYTDEVSAMLNP